MVAAVERERKSLSGMRIIINCYRVAESEPASDFEEHFAVSGGEKLLWPQKSAVFG
jgi:hypothetical protein